VETTRRTADDIAAIYRRQANDPRVIVASGYGIVIKSYRGHLVVEDGIGRHRRTREYSRIERTLQRVVIIGTTGYVTLQAQRWCRNVGITLVNIDNDGKLLWSSIHDTKNAKLLRNQALAGEDGPHAHVGLAVIKLLLKEKIREQASNLLLCLNSTSAGDQVAAHIPGIDNASSFKECCDVEAQAALVYWRALRDIAFGKPPTDWPQHWRTFGKRFRTVNGSGVRTARRATNPINAMLNYAYRIAEFECLLTCHAVGLHPALGFLHLDQEARDSLPMDLIEVVRPHVERHIFGMLGYAGKPRSFSRNDFREEADGTCRVLSPLTHELAEHCIDWSAIVQPFATRIAETLSVACSAPRRASSDGLTAEDLASVSTASLCPLPADIVPDDLWARVEPIVTTSHDASIGGRPRRDPRAVLAGILIARTDGWTHIPASLGVSRLTCNRRYQQWQADGRWQRIEDALREGQGTKSCVPR
jgi:CRISP-associated protein Cas1